MTEASREKQRNSYKSDASQKRMVKQTGVRWFELLCLQYFDPIRFIIIDLMYCLFLGIARWIVKQIWIEEGILASKTLKKIQKKMNEFQVPADLNQISKKVDIGEYFLNFTAD